MTDPISLIYELQSRDALTYDEFGRVVGYDRAVLCDVLADAEEPNIVKSVN